MSDANGDAELDDMVAKAMEEQPPRSAPKDFVAKPLQVRAVVWESNEPDPDTGATKGDFIVFHPDGDRIDVLAPEQFEAMYQEPPPYFLGPVKMAVGNTRLDGKRLSFVGTPEEVCAGQEAYSALNPTHMFVDEKVVTLAPGLICSLVLIDRIGRNEDARYARELQIQARVRREFEAEEAERLAKQPKLLTAAKVMAAEMSAKLTARQEELKALAEVGRKCQANHGKAAKGKGKK